MHLRPPRSEQGRLLLTLHPEIGCQTWTRTKTSGLTGRRATLTPPGNGAAGRISTCIVPLRRRMPHLFGHGSNCKLVSAAGVGFPSLTRWAPEVTLFAVANCNAPAIPRFQAGQFAAAPRADGAMNGAVKFGGETKSPLKRGLLSLTNNSLGISAESSAGTGFGNNGAKTTGAVSSQTCKHKGLIPQGPEPVRSLHLQGRRLCLVAYSASENLDSRFLPPEQNMREVPLRSDGPVLSQNDETDVVRQQIIRRWKILRENPPPVVKSARVGKGTSGKPILVQKKNRRRVGRQL